MIYTDSVHYCISLTEIINTAQNKKTYSSIPPKKFFKMHFWNVKMSGSGKRKFRGLDLIRQSY